MQVLFVPLALAAVAVVVIVRMPLELIVRMPLELIVRMPSNRSAPSRPSAASDERRHRARR